MTRFAELASVAASTKRSGGVADGLETAYAESIASLKCLPLDPVNPEMAQGIEGLSFRELLQTTVEGGLDILEGDLLVVGNTEYAIRAASEWTWPPDGTDFITLLLEERK